MELFSVKTKKLNRARQKFLDSVKPYLKWIKEILEDHDYKEQFETIPSYSSVLELIKEHKSYYLKTSLIEIWDRNKDLIGKIIKFEGSPYVDTKHIQNQIIEEFLQILGDADLNELKTKQISEFSQLKEILIQKSIKIRLHPIIYSKFKEITIDRTIDPLIEDLLEQIKKSNNI